MKSVAVIGGTEIIDGKFELKTIYEDFDYLIISYLSCSLLASSAIGLNNDITYAFINNKPVYVLNNGLEYEKLKQGALYNLYKAYKKTLENYGVIFIDSIDEIDSGTHKKIITYDDAIKINQKKIIVKKSTIITPLAMDICKQRNIIIIKED